MSGLERAATGGKIQLHWDLIQGGWRLLEALDHIDRGPDTAFWLWFRDVADWRLMFSGGDLTRAGTRRARRLVLETLARLEDPGSVTVDHVGIALDGARSVDLIRSAVHTGPGIHGIRINDNIVAGRHIRRAYVYRVI